MAKDKRARIPHRKHQLKAIVREAFTPPPDKSEATAARNPGYFPGSNYSDQEVAWLKVVEAFQKETGRKFLSHVDYYRLALKQGLGGDTTLETTMTNTPSPPTPAPANVLCGFSIRDHIAAFALKGVLAAHSGDVAMPSATEAARMAREYADALLAELKANPVA